MEVGKRLEVVQRHLESHPVSSAHTAQSRSYRYTLDNYDVLSDKDRMFYEENGYFVVRKLISEEKIEKYRERFRQICDKEVVVPGLIIMKDVAHSDKTFERNERTINKIQEFQTDPVLMDYCEDPQIVKYVEAFIGKNIMAMNTMLINKPPDPGTKTSRHPMHQDLHYFPFRPADRILTSWTAMQRITRENGCLVVLPGTHKGELLQHEYPKWEGGVNKFYHGVRDFDPNSTKVYLEMEPGDTVFFHSILIHGSGSNTSKYFRKAISCHYASSYCNYIDVKGTLQEKMGEEIKGMAVRRIGEKINFGTKDIFYLKGRLIQGERINL